MSVVVYTKDNCVACTATIRQFKKREIEFEEKLITDHLDHLRSQGHQSAPVVVAELSDGQTLQWSGYEPSKIKDLASLLVADSLAA